MALIASDRPGGSTVFLCSFCVLRGAPIYTLSLTVNVYDNNQYGKREFARATSTDVCLFVCEARALTLVCLCAGASTDAGLFVCEARALTSICLCAGREH